MYQSYPGGGAEPAAQAPERPSSIRSAAIILLWRRDSGTYIAASKAR